MGCASTEVPETETGAAKISVHAETDEQNTESAQTEETEKEVNPDAVLEVLPLVISEDNWTKYRTAYADNKVDDMMYQTIEGEGIFCTVKNNKTDKNSYYIWGYADETRINDWQWQLDLDNYQGDLPTNGSLCSFSGTFVKSASADDYYWLANLSLKTITPVQLNSQYDYDLRVMSPTLAYYQLCNVLGYPDKTVGQSICLYGRVESLNMDGIHTSLQHPTLNNFWSVQFDTQENVPIIDTTIVVSGNVTSSATITNATVKQSAFQFKGEETNVDRVIGSTTLTLPIAPEYYEKDNISRITFTQPYEATIEYFNSPVAVTTSPEEQIKELLGEWEESDVEMLTNVQLNTMGLKNIVVCKKHDEHYEIRAYQDIGNENMLYVNIKYPQTPFSTEEIYSSAQILTLDRIAELSQKII